MQSLPRIVSWSKAFRPVGVAALLCGCLASVTTGSDETNRSLLVRPFCRIDIGSPLPDGRGWSKGTGLPEIMQSIVVQPNPPGTRVRALADDLALYVRFDCETTDPRTLIEGHTGGDRVWVEVHPLNDAIERLRFETDFRGDRKVARLRRITGENSLDHIPDVWEEEAQTGISNFDVTIHHGLVPGGWQAEFILPWQVLGLERRPPSIGFGYGRIFGDTAPRAARAEAAWPRVDAVQPWSGFLEPGQALIGSQATAPAKWLVAPLRFGMNRGAIHFEMGKTRPALELSVRTEGPAGAAVGAYRSRVPTDATVIEFPFELSRAFDSHVDVFGPQRVIIELLSEQGAPVYSVRVPFGRHLGYCVDESYGTGVDTGAGTAAGHEAWLARVSRQLPRLKRATTRQGAASDFCLVDSEDRLVANLMSSDAWSRLAAVVEERFATAEDRLVGAMALVGQKSVTNLMLDPLYFRPSGEQYYHSSHHEMMGPLSIIRYGGGPAVSRAAVLARLLQQVANPATGRPFVTRVVSLTRNGGPEQTERRYTRSVNLSPFVEVPGRIGAVAVDYAGSQTLLDPTALGFFPTGNRLATVEELRTNTTLSRAGVGRLAAAYAGINIEEIRRERPNRLLSRGVFPEQAPEEDGLERPFELGAKFRVPFLVAGEKSPFNRAEGFVDEWGRPGTRSGAVHVEPSGQGWKFTVEVRGIRLSQLTESDRKWERVHLAIDGQHAHVTFRHFMLTAAGAANSWYEESQAIQTLCKHLATENWREIEELGLAGWKGTLQPQSDGYDAVFEISRGAARVGAGLPVVGFNVWIEGRQPWYEQVFLARPRRRLAADPPSFADLYLAPAPVAVTNVDLGVPTWLENEARIELFNLGERPVVVELQATNRLEMSRRTIRRPAVTATIPARARAEMGVPFFVDPEEKMGAGTRQEIVFSGRADGREFYRSAWGAAYTGAVAVYQRYGSELGPQPRPAVGDAYFGEKMIRWMSGQIPVFNKLTTRDGAGSDFVLRAEDGSAEFDLMEPTALRQISAYVQRRFHTDFERLLALYCLNLEPTVARHNSGGHHLMVGADPLSILRANFAGGGGNCGYHAALFAGLVAGLEVDGRPLSAHTIPVWGHAITAVSWKRSWALLDNDVGHLFFTPDGQDFARIEEFRKNPWLLTSASPGEVGRYYDFSEADVRTIPPGAGGVAACGVFPLGAGQSQPPSSSLP